MIRLKSLLVVFLLGLFCLTGVAAAQEEPPYDQGSVWTMSFIRTEPGRFDDYLNNLNSMWRKVNEEAMEQGLVLSYKIITANAANKDDWDLLLMVEYKNMAAFDGLDAKFRAIVNKLASEEDLEKGTVSRAKMREIIGGKLGRELSFK